MFQVKPLFLGRSFHCISLHFSLNVYNEIFPKASLHIDDSSINKGGHFVYTVIRERQASSANFSTAGTCNQFLNHPVIIGTRADFQCLVKTIFCSNKQVYYKPSGFEEERTGFILLVSVLNGECWEQMRYNLKKGICDCFVSGVLLHLHLPLVMKNT